MQKEWICTVCESTNFYEQTKICNVCGEEISQNEENRCIYEIAETLEKEAVTSKDFFAACEYYLKALSYKDARQRHSECNFKAEKTLLNEKIYEEAKSHFNIASEYSSSEKWAEAIGEFEIAEQHFKKAVKFLDSEEYASRCRRETELCHSRRIYFEAKKIMASAVNIDEYKKAEELFSKISKFADAKENQELCLKFIEQLTAKKQLEEIQQDSRHAEETDDLDKKIVILNRIVSLENAVLSDDAKSIVLKCKMVLEECLNKKRQIQAKLDLDEATEKYSKAINTEDYLLQIQSLEKILIDYKSYSQTAEFSQLFTDCNTSIENANKNIDYNNAINMMRKAAALKDFKSVAEAFARLSGFKDSDIKKKECDEKVAFLEKEAVYEFGLESYKDGRKINIFNWRKYR